MAKPICGKLIGAHQVALKVPFAILLFYLDGNAFDFSPDLSTIVYARPGGHADPEIPILKQAKTEYAKLQ